MSRVGTHCPNCGHRMVQVGVDGSVKIRPTMIAWGKGGDGQAMIPCRKCKADVPVDIRIGETLAKRLRPRMIIRAPSVAKGG